MYGVNKLPWNYETEDIKISLLKNGTGYEYLRDCQGKTANKLIQSDIDEILISPVEPLNLPNQISNFLLVEFFREMMLQPNFNALIYLTFPIEIGVFVGRKDKHEILDIFTLSRLKYTLYGEPRDGVICKYWQSTVHQQEPDTDPLREGVIQLNIVNNSHNWVQVNKALFNGNGMKLYYNKQYVSLKATMKILEEEAAEVEFHNSPLHRDMKKASELFSTRRLSSSSRKAVMLEGI
ncbi:MAG: DUF432 domain-containing protein [Candidatus Cloacimonetes bacterium]|nr:DUF432 domain-containing protein [Candidatus Cloacimonadota bacterium]